MNDNRRTDELTWLCEVCRRPIADGDGWLTVGFDELREYRRAAHAWEGEHVDERTGVRVFSASAFSTHPDLVCWHIRHEQCDPAPVASHAVAVERVRTPAQLLDCSAHLLEKKWLRSTTWLEILRVASSQLDDGREPT